MQFCASTQRACVHPSMHGRASHAARLSVLCMLPQAVKRLLQVSQSRDASLVEFPGAYHELFMGAERDASVKALRDWCEPARCARWLCAFPGHEPRRACSCSGTHAAL